MTMPIEILTLIISLAIFLFSSIKLGKINNQLSDLEKRDFMTISRSNLWIYITCVVILILGMAVADGLSNGTLAIQIPGPAAWLIYGFFFLFIATLLKKILAFKMKERALPRHFIDQTIHYTLLSFAALIVFIIVVFKVA